jgi:hydrogenase maturation factor
MNKRMSDPVPVPVGKLPPEILKEKILTFSGFKRPEVLVGPEVGEDACVIDIPGDRYTVVASDPIVGASEGAGRLLVHVNVNDIACKGGDPGYFMVTLIIPVSMGLSFAEKIMSEIDTACRELGIAIIGGHTEFTDRYDKPVIVGTAVGTTFYLYQAGSISPGDLVIMTKHVGLEGMSILANDRPDLMSQVLSPDEIAEVLSWSSSLSVYPESKLVRSKVKYMHDPTEGGLMGGLSEIAGSSGLGIDLYEDKIPVHPLTARVRQYLDFNILNLISSGVLVMVVPETEGSAVIETLDQHGISAAIIGKMVHPGVGNFKPDSHEELWRLLDMAKEEKQ